MTSELHVNKFNICNENSSLLFRACMVFTCHNTSWTTPTKKFLPIPDHPFKRKIWFEAIGRRFEDVATNSEIYCCEDHFDLTRGVKCFCKSKVNNCIICIRENFTPQLQINTKQNVNQSKGQNKIKITQNAINCKNNQDRSRCKIEQLNINTTQTNDNYPIPQPEFIAIKTEPFMSEEEEIEVINIKQEPSTNEEVIIPGKNSSKIKEIIAIPEKENDIPTYGIVSVPSKTSNEYYLVQIQLNENVKENAENHNVKQSRRKKRVSNNLQKKPEITKQNQTDSNIENESNENDSNKKKQKVKESNLLEKEACAGDIFTIFGKSVGEQLRSFPLEQAILLQGKIQDLISEEMLKL